MSVRIGKFVGALVALALVLALGSDRITAASGDARVLSLYNIHTKESLSILYKKDGRYIPEALKKLNWFFRDWRRDLPTRMDPKLFDIIWEMHEELGSRQPVHLLSGYRSRKTNNMLRRAVGGQARNSRHILGKAADIHFPDVPVRQMRYSAMVREAGGVGYYPTSALPFVHVDTGRVRHWPRMSRYELALLFPDGHTRHRPRSGGPITPRDARIARRTHKALAQKVAAYYALRHAPAGWRPRTRFAALSTARPKAPAITPPVPQLADDLRTAFAPRPLFSLASLFNPPAPRSAEHLRSALGGPVPAPEPAMARAAPRPRAGAAGTVRMAALDPQADLADRQGGVGNPWHDDRRAGGRNAAPMPSPGGEGARSAALAPGDEAELTPRPAPHWIRAPGYDEEHPEELSYRPMPVAPLLTASPGERIPVLSQLLQPDMSAERIFELLDQRDRLLPLRFRPGLQFAEMLWANRFSLDAVAGRAGVLGGDGRLRARFVHTARN